MKKLVTLTAMTIVLAGCGGKPPASKPAKASPEGSVAKSVPSGPRGAAIDKAVDFLLGKQNDDGGFGSFKGQPMSSVGVTGLVTLALLDSPKGLTESSSPVVAKAVKYMVSNQQPNGALAVAGQGLENYHTSAAVVALVRTGNPQYKDVLSKAKTFLKTIQLGMDNGFEKSDAFFGGAPYSPGAKYSDLSNTSFWIEAMKELGVDEDDPAMKNAKLFVSRVSNNPEINDMAWAKEVAPEDFGSGVYRPAAAPGREGEVDISKAGKREGRQGWRGYGSMTYAMFKSYIYMGMKKDDPAVQAALKWIEKNYTLEENPGLGTDGQYYYYRLLAKALHAFGQEEVAGHDWAGDLADKLVALQLEDGSWVNPKDRWHEGDPALVTAYSLEALSLATRGLEKDK